MPTVADFQYDPRHKRHRRSLVATRMTSLLECYTWTFIDYNN